MEGLRRYRALGEFPVVLEEEVAQADLDFIGRKESSRAGVQTVAESHLLRTGAYQVSKMLLLRVITHSQPAVAIVLVWIRVVLLVPHVSVLENDSGTLLDEVTVGELDISCGKSAESC